MCLERCGIDEDSIEVSRKREGRPRQVLKRDGIVVLFQRTEEGEEKMRTKVR